MLAVPRTLTTSSARRRSAAALAGLDEVTLLAEPVAACVAHGLSGATGRVLVFDLGAGTFDVSVVSLGADGDVEVIATSGDARLGGNDFDAALVQWLGDEFARGAGDDGDAAAGGSPRRRRQQRCGSPSSSRSTSSRKASPTARRWRSRAQPEVLCEPLRSTACAALRGGAERARRAPRRVRGRAGGGEAPGHAQEAEEEGATRRGGAHPEGTQRRLPLGEAVSEVVMVGGASRMSPCANSSPTSSASRRKTVDPMAAVALGACAHAGASGEIDGVRVLQAWQAQLGCILDAARAGVELEKDDAGDEGEELEQVPDR